MTNRRRNRLPATLAYPEFRRLFLGYVISAMGDGLQPLTLTFLVLLSGGGVGGLGLVLACGEVPTILFSLIGGVWADRVDRKRVLILSNLGQGAAQAVTAVLALTGRISIVELALFNVVYGTFRSLSAPAVFGLIPQTLPEGALAPANSLMYSVRTVCYFLGAPIAGAIVALAQPAWATALDALSFAVSVGLLSRISVTSVDSLVRNSILADLGEGWREVRSRAWLLTELVRSAFDFPLVVAPFMLLGPIIATQRLQGALGWSLITTGFFAGTVIGPFFAQRFRPRRPMLVCTLLMYTSALSPFLLATVHTPLPIAVSELVHGAAVGFFGATWNTLLQRRIAPHVRSRVGAWDFTLTTGLTPVGYIAAAVAAAHIGATTVLGFGACWIIVTVSLALLVPSVRNLRDDPRAVNRDAAPPALVEATESS